MLLLILVNLETYKDLMKWVCGYFTPNSLKSKSLSIRVLRKRKTKDRLLV